MRQISLQQLTIRYVVIMLSLVAIFAFVSFVSIKSLLNESQQDKQLINLEVTAYNISVRIDFYRDIMRKLANVNETKDLVVFGEEEEAQTWAKKIQLLIPDSISVALFNEEGKILGQREALRVGDLCYLDLHRRISNAPLTEPPIHRGAASSFAHFDLFQDIEANNVRLGILFASFKLSILQILLDRLSEEGQNLELYAGDNTLIVSSNKFENKNPEYIKKQISHIIPIANTDWYLKAHLEKNKLTEVLAYIAYANMILFFLLSAMLFIFSNGLANTFSSDFKTIQGLLKDLKNHDLDINKDVSSKLRETEGIITNIKQLTDEISTSQKQLVKYSHHDDLTGLLNRRGFFQESPRCIDLAKRSIESVLVLLDLDYFKQINDSLGHATGDKVLEILSTCMKSSSRSVDIAARLGGDEFAVILVSCDIQHAMHWYENLSEQFFQQQKYKIALSNNTKHCTLSAGCTSIEITDNDISIIIARADKALYVAKNSGKNNIKPYEAD